MFSVRRRFLFLGHRDTRIITTIVVPNITPTTIIMESRATKFDDFVADVVIAASIIDDVTLTVMKGSVVDMICLQVERRRRISCYDFSS